MILYKYVRLEHAGAILGMGKVGFSRCASLNDPFEGPRYPRNANEDIFSSLGRMGKEMTWEENSRLLCLTRTPTNPLMWAHYADNHRGAVLAIDMQIAGLADQTGNLVPAPFGSVTYASQQPRWDFVSKFNTGIAVGETYDFPLDHFEKLQRLFLTKPIQWAYEEEVRVVKCVRSRLIAGEHTTPSGQWTVEGEGDGARFFYHLPVGSIREVYFGFRAEPEQCDELRATVTATNPHIDWLECALDPDNYAVRPRPHTAIADSVG